jgi:hypothetical protein
VAVQREKRTELMGSRIPVKGVAGLIFAVAFMVLILVAVPAARWFFALALPAGVLVGGVLCLWHSRSR